MIVEANEGVTAMTVPQACTRHTMDPCPRSCWRAGLTIFSYFEGRLVFTRSYATPVDVDYMLKWYAHTRTKTEADYAAIGRHAPSQYAAWTYTVWGADAS
jgi:hypothetical protein